MSNWVEYKLSDACDITTGFAFKGNEYSSTGSLKVVRGENVTIGNLRWDSEKHWNNSTQGLDKYLLRENDIVIGMDGSRVGQNRALIKKDELPLILAQRVALLRAKVNFDQKFIWYIIFSDYFKNYIDLIHTGTSIPHISQSQLGGLRIKAPDKKSQTIISDILNCLDRKINHLDHQDQILEQLMNLVITERFIGNENKDWTLCGLDNIAEFLNGLACQKYPVKNNEKGLPVIKIKEMHAGITESSDIVTNHIPEKYLIHNGDLLFSWSGSLDVIIWFGGTGVLNQHLFKVSSTEFPQWFIYFWTKYHLPEFRSIAKDKATTMGHIQRHHLSGAIVKVPDQKELNKINSIIDPLFQKLKSNKKQIQTLTQLRDSLLPKLMSGEIRIKS